MLASHLSVSVLVSYRTLLATQPDIYVQYPAATQPPSPATLDSQPHVTRLTAAEKADLLKQQLT